MTATAGGAPGAAHTVLATRLGEVTVVREEGALTGLYFPRHWPRPDRTAFGPRADEGFEDVARQLGEYLAGDRSVFELPVKVKGTDFDRRVWELVAGVPYGETTTYGDLARGLGAGTDPRDVGAAVGRNPLCIVIPCHRVIGSTGKLTGYAGGLEPEAHPARDRARAGCGPGMPPRRGSGRPPSHGTAPAAVCRVRPPKRAADTHGKKGNDPCRSRRTRPLWAGGSREFWGKDFNPAVIDELAAPDIRFEYSLHEPLRGRDAVRAFAGEVPRRVPGPELLGHRRPDRRGRLRGRPVGRRRHPHRGRVRRHAGRLAAR